MKDLRNALMESTVARFSIAMMTSLLITSATFIPLIAHLSRFTYATPVALAAARPQGLSPPPTQYPSPQLCLGNCSMIHDPNIVYENGTYWRFSTQNNIPIATASSLEGPWKYQGNLLHNGTSIDLRADQEVWVPTVFKQNDTFFCHYAVSYMGSQRSEIGVATSTSLFPGSWTDHGSLGLPQSAAYNLIDPYVFQEDDDAPIYFTFGSYWTGIQQLQLPSHSALTSWSSSSDDIKNVIRNTTANLAVQEGATMYKHEEYYYIFFSVGQCCLPEDSLAPRGDEYHVAVCRAHTTTGPYSDAQGKDCLTDNGGTTILASHGDVYAPGGQGIMLDSKSGREVMYYHYSKPSVGYEYEKFLFGFNYLEWKDAWPLLVPEQSQSVNIQHGV